MVTFSVIFLFYLFIFKYLVPALQPQGFVCPPPVPPRWCLAQGWWVGTLWWVRKENSVWKNRIVEIKPKINV